MGGHIWIFWELRRECCEKVYGNIYDVTLIEGLHACEEGNNTRDGIIGAYEV